MPIRPQGAPAPVDKNRCVTKLGEPCHMRECGAPTRYLTAEQARAEGMQYSGWRHADRALDADHGAFPRSAL